MRIVTVLPNRSTVNGRQRLTVTVSRSGPQGPSGTGGGGGGGTGDVTGPASSVTGRAVVFASTTGKAIAQAAGPPMLVGDAPTAHAASHAAAGSDPVTVAQSQVTGLPAALAGKVDTSDARLTDTRTPTDGSVTASKLATGAVTSAAILDGTIVDGDVSATAAIALSKLADDPLARANHTGTQGSSTITGGLARQPIVAASKITDVTSTAVYTGSSLVPVVGNTASTLALALGTVYMARAHHDGATINRLVFVVTASSLTAGQSITIACFNDSSGTPTTRAWSQSVTVGTGTGAFITSGLSLAMPTGPCWVAILNPSGNAGTVTLRSHQTVGNLLTVANDSAPAGIALESQSSMPSDVSSNTLRTSTATSTFAVGAFGPTFPKIIANAS